VLVVEDEAALSTALAEGLGQDGFAVETVTDGLLAWDRLLYRTYDLILLDLMLPGLGGLPLCARLRDSGVATPVLVLTARTAEHDQLRAFDTGADDFLAKPFSYRILLARVRALLRRTTEADSRILTAGDLVLDRGARSCRRGETGIELTSREFALLEVLMAQSGQVVSRRTALDEVWDFALDEDSKVLDVYIGYLRRKVDVPFDRHAVRTVRGFGYLLDADGG
jgi:DNA-binding response OmpR family regulator